MRILRIHEFAEMAGVTVKALRHYDRVGLLVPARNGAGYRVYNEKDLERLEQVVALRFLGMPLKQIKTVLDRVEIALSDALRMQRKALEEKQSLLGRAIRAIHAAEDSLEPGKPADPVVLKKIIEAIDMQTDIEAMKKYYTSDEAWDTRKRYYEEGPAQEWQELYRDVAAALGEDPASDKALELSDRWLQLSIRAYAGDPALQTDSPAAWLDREHWPPAMKRRIEEFRLEEVKAFVSAAAIAARKKYFGDEAWSRLNLHNFNRLWQVRVDLFTDIERAQVDSAEDASREFADRWLAYLDAMSDGQPEVKAGFMAGWADRKNWSATLLWREEGQSRMSGERFEKAAAVLDRALERTGCK